MDNTEIHYLTYDPEEIYKEMLSVYAEAGGEVPYPGDEKEMLLRGVQAIMVHAFAGVDNALRMATLRYATGDYLDLYGQNRGCIRQEAQKAKAMVEITFGPSGKTDTIKAGTALTADGVHLYSLDEDFIQTGYQQTGRVSITANDSGSVGNGLLSGTQMQFLIPLPEVISVFCVSDGQGGQDREEDESYRERIQSFGLVGITTGPRVQYEAAAMNVSSEILDARAVNQGAGKVGIFLLLANETGSGAIMEAVATALNGENCRPMTDMVTVYLATEIPYTLNVQYRSEAGVAAAVAAAVAEYQNWQDNTIGRAFNPDRLMASIYQAGAERVVWAEGSNFHGGGVEYTEIEESAHCKGEISLEAIG